METLLSFLFFLVGQRAGDEGRRKKKEKRRVEMEWHNIVRQEEVEGGIISRGERGGYVEGENHQIYEKISTSSFF